MGTARHLSRFCLRRLRRCDLLFAAALRALIRNLKLSDGDEMTLEQTEYDLELVEAAMYDFRLRLDGEERGSTLAAWERLKALLHQTASDQQMLNNIINDKRIEVQHLKTDVNRLRDQIHRAKYALET